MLLHLGWSVFSSILCTVVYCSGNELFFKRSYIHEVWSRYVCNGAQSIAYKAHQLYHSAVNSYCAHSLIISPVHSYKSHSTKTYRSNSTMHINFGSCKIIRAAIHNNCGKYMCISNLCRLIWRYECLWMGILHNKFNEFDDWINAWMCR